MRSKFCEWEGAVSEAVASGQWTDELREHVAICQECADLCLVADYLASAGAGDAEAISLPSPGLIWWRAQLAERREQTTRAVAAIDIMHKVAIAVGLLAVVVFGWVWKTIDWQVLAIGVAMLVCTAVALYGWVRGRI